MFDKLITIIQQFIHELIPVFIIDQWDEGVVLRVGKFLKIVRPGIYFKIPFIDSLRIYLVMPSLIIK